MFALLSGRTMKRDMRHRNEQSRGHFQTHLAFFCSPGGLRNVVRYLAILCDSKKADGTPAQSSRARSIRIYLTTTIGAQRTDRESPCQRASQTDTASSDTSPVGTLSERSFMTMVDLQHD